MNQFLSFIDQQFERLHARSMELIAAVPPDKLFWQPREPTLGVAAYSCGEYVLRSAGAVEQTFGGISTNLWDDPFEWTLPETLSTSAKIAEYLEEVEATRNNAFGSFKSDSDLFKEIAVPSGEPQAIYALLIETLARASHFQGRAFATFRLFSSARLPMV
jgi:hypothetical protein